MRKPIVALVGRPNVGKSTLFNRLIGERRAIVQDEPGTTRDRLYGEAEWSGQAFIVVDTGGLDVAATDKARQKGDQPESLSVSSRDFVREIREQAEVAIEQADVVVFLVDAKDGITAADQDVAEILRRSGRPVVLAVEQGRQRSSPAELRLSSTSSAWAKPIHLGPSRHGHRRLAG